MKIDGNQLGGVPQQPTVQKPGLQEAAEAESAKRAARVGYRNTEPAPETGLESTSDQVELSGLGRELSRLAQADPDREARIEKLAGQYEKGRLEVDAGKVASKIVDDAFHSD